MSVLLQGLLYIVLAPILGGLLSGFDRILTARIQSRVGPPILQPFYDVGKLFSKEQLLVLKSQSIFVIGLLISMIITGALFFAQQDFLIVMFVFSLSGVFLVLAAYQIGSPYSFVGAERELIQMLAYEPMILLIPVGVYMAIGSFSIQDILNSPDPLFFQLPGIFFGYLYVLTIKLRKGPFDLSASHHAHQELVKGITTEFSGPNLALIELAHWYENILLLGIIYIFFAPWPVVAVLVAIGTYALEIFVDNSFSRVKWDLLLKSSWWMTLILGGGNIVYLYLVKQFPALFSF
ncbi:MAG: NADH-quinone oxidoreductase subunit H [Oligoflexia bacterium]|nr:NADH-quinone oxidoreductase subunit H [Oligoflexia bacterium]MBF0364361.1 NADH-quinone oxidoreductase subunit H [Oligoflexia bacterium]